MRRKIWILLVLGLATECIATSRVGQERVYEGTITLNIQTDIRLGLISTRRLNWQAQVREFDTSEIAS